jgi:hypothetical protein
MRIVASAYSAGDVIVYPYRWAGERSQARAVDGAKDRPCCLVLTTIDKNGREIILLAAISSKPPRGDQAAIKVPDIERRRAGIDRYPDAWVYVDEVNQDRPADSWYLQPQTPLGAFSRSFLSKVSVAITGNIRAGGIVARR